MIKFRHIARPVKIGRCNAAINAATPPPSATRNKPIVRAPRGRLATHATICRIIARWCHRTRTCMLTHTRPTSKGQWSLLPHDLRTRQHQQQHPQEHQQHHSTADRARGGRERSAASRCSSAVVKRLQEYDSHKTRVHWP